MGRFRCAGSQLLASLHNQGRVIVTWSNVAVARVVLEWLDTASPTNAFAGSVMVSLPTSDHVIPSDDWYADSVAPLRVSFTQYGR